MLSFHAGSFETSILKTLRLTTTTLAMIGAVGLSANMALAAPRAATTTTLAAPATVKVSSHFTAEITAIGKTDVLFKNEHTDDATPTGKVAHGIFKDLDGKELVIEEAVFDAGGKLISYEQNQKQIAADGKIEIKNGEILFSYTKDGTTKTAMEKATDDFVVSSSMVAYTQKHWDEILKGDKVRIHFGVLDRRESIEFKLYKIESPEPGKVLVKMQAASFLIAALVNPLIFTYSADGSHLLQLKGRTPLKLKNDSGSWKDFDGVTTYHY
jgi:hypothetical protein